MAAPRSRVRRWRNRRSIRPRRRMMRRVPAAAAVHLHKKTVFIRNWQSATNTTGFSVGRTFQLSDLGGEVLSLANLYQLYCLKGVKVEVIPQANSNEVGQSGAPEVHSAIDYVDNSAKPVTALMEYASYKCTRGTSVHKRYFKPRIQDTIYSGGLTPAYASHTGAQWLSTQTNNSTACPHFGLCITSGNIQTGGDLTMYFDLKVTYYLAFKSSR